MKPYLIGIEENAKKVEDLGNLCIANYKRSVSLFYRVLYVLSQDFRQKESNFW